MFCYEKSKQLFYLYDSKDKVIDIYDNKFKYIKGIKTIYDVCYMIATFTKVFVCFHEEEYIGVARNDSIRIETLDCCK